MTRPRPYPGEGRFEDACEHLQAHAALFQTFLGTLLQDVSTLIFAITDDAPGTTASTSADRPQPRGLPRRPDPHDESPSEEPAEKEPPHTDDDELWIEEDDDEEALVQKPRHPAVSPAVPFCHVSFMIEALAGGHLASGATTPLPSYDDYGHRQDFTAWRPSCCRRSLWHIAPRRPLQLPTLAKAPAMRTATATG